MEITFKVSSYKKIANPYVNSLDGFETKPQMYMVICDVKDLPDNIPMETNPREQNEKTKVAKKIETSLLEIGNKNFYLLNRGLLLSCETINFNPKNSTVTLNFSNLNYHGDVDGGHTYKIILKNKNSIDYGQQYVKIEILTGIEDMFEQLASARNSSVQVQDKSIAELEKKFDMLKSFLKNTKFANEISYKENEDKRIDIGEILAILYMFNIDKFPNNDFNNFPTAAYSSKKKCIDAYLDEYNKNGNSLKNPYHKMEHIIKDIFNLYDMLEENMSEFYRKSENGIKKYGAITGVTMPKVTKFITKFNAKPLSYKTPISFLYPIIGSFKALLEEKNGYYEWKADPFKVLLENGPNLVSQTIYKSRELGNNPNATGKSFSLWKELFIWILFKSIYEKK